MFDFLKPKTSKISFATEKDEIAAYRAAVKAKQERESMQKEKSMLKRELEGPSFKEKLGGFISGVSQAKKEFEAKQALKAKMAYAKERQDFQLSKLRYQKEKVEAQRAKLQTPSDYGMQSNPFEPKFSKEAIDSLVPKYKPFK